ncbi:hypothetical protein [Carnobacterium maltaromaticum]|uniref:hypothetical protein n=1 Tax=Carnobacterium maltaromaticum TaxID=2751 RepID=UPI00295E87C8|nr:hypothetical protein [Carnobacterium maltaromaticum]
MSSGLIKIDLNAHEELIQYTEQLMDDTMELMQKLQSANEVIGAIAVSGSFKDKIIANGDSLSRFTRKAQTLFTLAEVMNGHVNNVFKEMVDADKLVALKISEMLIQDPEMGSEISKAFKEDPKKTFNAVKEAVKNTDMT